MTVEKIEAFRVSNGELFEDEKEAKEADLALQLEAMIKSAISQDEYHFSAYTLSLAIVSDPTAWDTIVSTVVNAK